MKEKCKLLVAVLLFAAAASAQNVSSSVRGVLIDPAGAVIPGAICTLTNEATGTVSTAASWEDGVFTFPNISRGAYTLKVKADGFKLLSIGAIPVSSGETHAPGPAGHGTGRNARRSSSDSISKLSNGSHSSRLSIRAESVSMGFPMVARRLSACPRCCTATRFRSPPPISTNTFGK